MSYESPITVIYDAANQMSADIENHIYRAVLKIGIGVNKEELVKALQYDRNQYEKGYADGRNDAITHAHWEKVADHVFRCSLCNNHRRYAQIIAHIVVQRWMSRKKRAVNAALLPVPQFPILSKQMGYHLNVFFVYNF